MSAEKWHASHVTMIAGGTAALFAAGSLLVPDPQLKRDLASAALMSVTGEGILLWGDAIVGSARNKLKEATGRQKSSG